MDICYFVSRNIEVNGMTADLLKTAFYQCWCFWKSLL